MKINVLIALLSCKFFLALTGTRIYDLQVMGICRNRQRRNKTGRREKNAQMTRDTILIVEERRFFGSILQKRISADTEFVPLWVSSYRQAKQALEEKNDRIFTGLLDIQLSDATEDEIVDLFSAHRIPAIIFTEKHDKELRDKLWEKRVVDYVVKNEIFSIDYILNLINRLDKNRKIDILIVDDSRAFRNELERMVQVHMYRTFKAENGEQALEILKDNTDIKLALVDYYMPGMTGDQLCSAMRKTHSRSRLGIIGMSSKSESFISVNFIKSGATDFLSKPFYAEEFYCRLNNTIEMIEFIRQIEELSNKDYLTGIFNRRYFFDQGELVYALSENSGSCPCVAMLDIDFFKDVNDTYGHKLGDFCLKQIGTILAQRFSKDEIAARIGGEEFCVLIPDCGPHDPFHVFDRLREEIKEIPIHTSGGEIHITVSIGVYKGNLQELEKAVAFADRQLYMAKENGRDQVRVSGDTKEYGTGVPE